MNKEDSTETESSSENNTIETPLWAELFPNRYQLEVIQRGVEKFKYNIKENAKRILLGRSKDCDVVLDNIMVSKYHLMIIYGKNIDKELKFWVTDLYSQNRSKINKSPLQPYIFYVFNVGDVVQVSHNEFSIILNYTGGLDRIEDVNEKSFISNSEKKESIGENKKIEDFCEIVEKYFDRKGLEPEYVVEGGTVDGDKFIVSLILPVYNEDGEELTARSIGNKRSDAIKLCAKNAYDLIEKYDTLEEIPYESVQQRKKREYIENDFYEEDDDVYYDRSGDVEKKRQKRLERYGKSTGGNVQNFNSLKAKLEIIRGDINDLVLKSSEINCNKDEENNEEDDLDKYMNGLQKDVNLRLLDKYQKDIEILRNEEKDILRVLKFLDPIKCLGLVQITPQTSSDNTNSTPSPKKISNKRKIQPTPTINNINETSPKDDVPKKRKSISHYCDDEDGNSEWVPPQYQTGDGLTSLNDKYDY